MAKSALPQDVPEEVDGETVILAAELSERWTSYRCCTCTLGILATGPVGLVAFPFFAPLYACFGPAARKEEYESFQLLLTQSSLHFQQKTYACGCCCQSTTHKSVPLDRIQDIRVVSDCCGDCCGWSDGPGIPWRLEVQTAGSSGGEGGSSGPELTAFCVKDTVAFRRAVLDARRRLRGGGDGGPAPKEAPASSPHGRAASAAVGDSDHAAATLDRMEALMREALELMRAKHRAEDRGGAGGGAKASL